jgi:hypothetical protein
VPTYDCLEHVDLDDPGDVDQALDNLVDAINTGYFLQWEAVVHQERGLRPSTSSPLISSIGYGCKPVLTRSLASHTIHERLMALLMCVSPPKVFATVTADKIVELMQLGAGEGAPLIASLGQVVASFYEVLGFPRVESEAVLRQAIADGVEAGTFGYVGRAAGVAVDRVREGSEYFVSPELVRIGARPAETQLDMSTGLIVLPEAIKRESPPPETPGAGDDVSIVPPDTGGTGVTPPPPKLPALQTAVHLRMRVNRQQIYPTTNALANLAQAAGSIQLTVEAYRPEGFEPGWLQNAVLEPLDESDVELEE